MCEKHCFIFKGLFIIHKIHIEQGIYSLSGFSGKSDIQSLGNIGDF